MAMNRMITGFAASLSLLTVPGAQAGPRSTLYVVGPTAASMDVRTSCDARWRDMTASERTHEENYGRFLDRCLARCPTLGVNDTQDYFEGRVRRSCDADWQRKIEANTVGDQTYPEFIADCGRSCQPPAILAQAPDAPIAGAPADAGAGAASGGGSAAGGAAATGAASQDLLLFVGTTAVAATVFGILASDDGPDRPASP